MILRNLIALSGHSIDWAPAEGRLFLLTDKNINKSIFQGDFRFRLHMQISHLLFLLSILHLSLTGFLGSKKRKKHKYKVVKIMFTKIF